MRFSNGNGFIFSIGTFRIIVPPLELPIMAPRAGEFFITSYCWTTAINFVDWDRRL